MTARSIMQRWRGKILALSARSRQFFGAAPRATLSENITMQVAPRLHRTRP
jgi:hypothetical protein